MLSQNLTIGLIGILLLINPSGLNHAKAGTLTNVIVQVDFLNGSTFSTAVKEDFPKIETLRNLPLSYDRNKDRHVTLAICLRAIDRFTNSSEFRSTFRDFEPPQMFIVLKEPLYPYYPSGFFALKEGKTEKFQIFNFEKCQGLTEIAAAFDSLRIFLYNQFRLTENESKESFASKFAP